MSDTILKEIEQTKNLSFDEQLKQTLDFAKQNYQIDFELAKKDNPEDFKKLQQQVNNYLERIQKQSKTAPFTAPSTQLTRAATSVGKFPTDKENGVLCYLWAKEKIDEFAAAKGDDIKNQIINEARNLQIMQSSLESGGDTPGWEKLIAKVFIGIGILAVGYTGFRSFRTYWRANPTQARNARIRGATAAALKSIGKSVLITIVANLIISLIGRLINPRAQLYLIMNCTNEDLVFNKVHFDDGKMQVFFKKDESLDNPQAIMSAQMLDDDEGGTGELLGAFVGYMGSESKSIGADIHLGSTGGAIRFNETKSFPQGVNLGWSVPRVGDNKILVKGDFDGSLQDVFKQTKKSSSLESTSTSKQGSKITGRINSKSGPFSYGIVTIKGN